MLHLYVLYACVYVAAKKPAPQAAPTRCVEGQIFFRPEPCKRELPKGGLTQKSRHSRSWLECEETTADSWLPAGGSGSYKAAASVSDGNGLAALLAPLSAQARATLAPGDLKQPFQRAFQGPSRFSFFLVGTGSSVTVYAVSNVDDFQFAQMAADLSSSVGDMATEKDLDFATVAENAGVQLSYHTKTLQRTMPPPGGMETNP